MIIGAHGDFVSAHFVCNAIVETVGDDIYVMTAHGLMDKRLGFAGTESGAIDVDEIGGSLIVVAAPFLEIIVNLGNKLLTAAHADNGKISIQKFLHDYLATFYVLYSVRISAENDRETANRRMAQQHSPVWINLFCLQMDRENSHAFHGIQRNNRNCVHGMFSFLSDECK
jgi:hypothetical protein